MEPGEEIGDKLILAMKVIGSGERNELSEMALIAVISGFNT